MEQVTVSLLRGGLGKNVPEGKQMGRILLFIAMVMALLMVAGCEEEPIKTGPTPKHSEVLQINNGCLTGIR